MKRGRRLKFPSVCWVVSENAEIELFITSGCQDFIQVFSCVLDSVFCVQLSVDSPQLTAFPLDIHQNYQY
jgi:hypothetical protein